MKIKNCLSSAKCIKPRFIATSFLCAFVVAHAHSSDLVNISFTKDELEVLQLQNIPPETLKMKLVVSHLASLKNTQSSATQKNHPLANLLGPLMPAASVIHSEPPALTEASAKQTAVSPDEDSLAKVIANRKPIQQPIAVSRLKDGFEVNGERYVDPEGRMGFYAVDYLTGDASYIVKTANPGEFLVKSLRLTTGDTPLTIARARETGQGWSVTTATGKLINGSRLVIGSQGIVVTRNEGDSAFLYTPGKGIKNISLPAGYQVANFQNGDISSTRYLLMEKIKQGGDDALQTLKSLGSVLGIGRKEDYALLDIDSGNPLFINISSDGKDVTQLSNCRESAKSRYVNICKDGVSYESLYDNKGMPNFTHYYWRIQWYRTPDARRVAVMQEGGLGNVSIFNMDTGSRRPLFERTLGIAGFSSLIKQDGKIEVTAKMGFSRERIDDALAVLDGEAPKPVVMGSSLF